MKIHFRQQVSIDYIVRYEVKQRRIQWEKRLFKWGIHSQ